MCWRRATIGRNRPRADKDRRTLQINDGRVWRWCCGRHQTGTGFTLYSLAIEMNEPFPMIMFCVAFANTAHTHETGLTKQFLKKKLRNDIDALPSSTAFCGNMAKRFSSWFLHNSQFQSPHSAHARKIFNICELFVCSKVPLHIAMKSERTSILFALSVSGFDACTISKSSVQVENSPWHLLQNENS